MSNNLTRESWIHEHLKNIVKGLRLVRVGWWWGVGCVSVLSGEFNHDTARFRALKKEEEEGEEEEEEEWGEAEEDGAQERKWRGSEGEREGGETEEEVRIEDQGLERGRRRRQWLFNISSEIPLFQISPEMYQCSNTIYPADTGFTLGVCREHSELLWPPSPLLRESSLIPAPCLETAVRWQVVALELKTWHSNNHEASVSLG